MLFEEEMSAMKRLRLLVVVGVIAAAIPLSLTAAKATGGGGGYPPPANSVSINYDAQYDALGAIIHVGLNVRCKNVGGAPGQVDVSVSQSPPESPTPATGDGLTNVVCDGRTHSVGVTLGGIGFDAGKAKATATLVPPVADVTHSVTTSRTINIAVMNPA
jgi:hypothetical protein